MPYAIKKNPDGRTYRVINTDTGAVHAKRTSRAHAEAQVRMLQEAEQEKHS